MPINEAQPRRIELAQAVTLWGNLTLSSDGNGESIPVLEQRVELSPSGRIVQNEEPFHYLCGGDMFTVFDADNPLIEVWRADVVVDLREAPRSLVDLLGYLRGDRRFGADEIIIAFKNRYPASVYTKFRTSRT